MSHDLENLMQAAELEKTKQWARLLDFSETWCDVEPRNHLAWQARGDALRNLKRPLEARDAYHAGLRVAPAQPTTLLGARFSAGSLWYRMGNVQRECGNLEEAILALLQAGLLDPNVADIWNDLGITYMDARDSRAAMDAFKRALKIEPANLNALRNLGTLYAVAGSREGVDAIYEIFKTLDPAAARAFHQHAMSLLSRPPG